MSTPKPPPGHFTLLYFAAAASYTSKQHEFLPAPLPARKLFEVLNEKYPGIEDTVLVSCALTLNLDYLDLEEEGTAEHGCGHEHSQGVEIQEGDEVAVIPPVSSG